MTAAPVLAEARERYPWRRHLSMAEVMEYERLVALSRLRTLPPDEQRRLADLGSRRVRT